MTASGKTILKERPISPLAQLTPLHHKPLNSSGSLSAESTSCFSSPSASPTTPTELATIRSLNFFFPSLDIEQAHAVICDASHILCFAGAGTGKTTVLTKRIEFLTTFRSTDPANILAITFTKKARSEMQHRLSSISACRGVHIETFNSFCERLISQHLPSIYSRPIVSARDRYDLLRTAITHLSGSEDRAFHTYFTPAQIRLKSRDELLGTLVFDVFSVIDHYKNERRPIERFYDPLSDIKDKSRSKYLHALCLLVQSYISSRGLRDYTDQIIDILDLFSARSHLIPKYSHLLVDEFQDTNTPQICLLDILAPDNLFCVGDPRQSIYQWRGSDPSHLYNFAAKYPCCKIIHLTTNYRSTPPIVNLANALISPLNLPALKSSPASKLPEHPSSNHLSLPQPSSLKSSPQSSPANSSGHLPLLHHPQLIEFPCEESEWDFICREVSTTTLPLHDIFILARTHRQLSALSSYLSLHKIPHITKTDESRYIHLQENHLTLATVHAIKGLEASTVYLIGSNPLYFPCRVSEHPVLDNLKTYDTHQEELRLFYVAITRAQKRLVMTYTSKNPTYFLTPSALSLCERPTPLQPIPSLLRYQHRSASPEQILTHLRHWRSRKAAEKNLAHYMILPDRTLQHIAHARPLNTDELKGISGLGPVKIHQYGLEILAILKTLG